MMNSTPFSGASWIASSYFGGPRTQEPAPYFRKTFYLDRPVTGATLHVTGLGAYECEINGARIGEDVLAPGWTDYRKTIYFESYDVSPLLQTGENVLGAILGSGWYCGFVAWRNRQAYGDRPRLLARLEIFFDDGTSQQVVTDDSWQTLTGPILENDLLMGESYDARRELGLWSEAGFDASPWSRVVISPPEGEPVLLRRAGPPVRRMGEIAAISMREFPNWTGSIRVYDMGQNFAGRVKIRVRAGAGRTLRLRHAEMLEPDGYIYTENLRTARAEDSYVCRSDGEEVWEPRFTFHGFRYVEATGLLETDTLEVTGIVLHSAMETTGSFACSNPLLNQLQSNILWGQKSNFLDVPTDCPQRDERMGWTGDAQIFARTAAFNMDVQGFFRKWMQDVRDGQHPSGGVPCVIPNLNIADIFDADGGPAWSDATVICPWTIYLCYGDREILADHYTSMQRYLDFLLTQRCVGMIRSHPDVKGWLGYGDWLALDGSKTDFGSTPFDLIGTAFLAYVLDIMAKIANILEHREDESKYGILHARVVEAFRSRFVSPDGLIVSGTQTASVLALQFGILTAPEEKIVSDNLVRQIERNGWHMATGFVGTPYLLGALERTGHLDVAYRLLEQEAFPSWLFSVKNGATTIWERWDAWTLDKGFQGKGMNSFNHYAYGAVGEWMYRTVAGLDLDENEPGYRHIIFRPRPGGTLTWAEASLQTAYGLAAIRWELISSGFRVKIVVPDRAYGTLDVPPGYYTSDPCSDFSSGTYELEVLAKSQGR